MKKKVPAIKQEVEELRQLMKAEKDVQKHQRSQALYLLQSKDTIGSRRNDEFTPI